MRITQAYRRMLAKEGLVVHKTKMSVTVYRKDGKRMTEPQYKLSGEMMRKSGGYQLPK